MSLRPLYLNYIAEFDWLIALEFGRVDDAQPPENWRGVSESFGFLHKAPNGPELGFKILHFSEFDPDAPEVAEIWEAPRFDVPVLGLRGVTPGEIVLAARALFGECSSINRHYFNAATLTTGEEALGLWLACLQAGDSMAHFGLGYTLYELGRFQESYRHLRHYAEIAPCGGWNWCWLGQAAEAIGETEEARRAFQRTIELGDDAGATSEAQEFLEALDSGPVELGAGTSVSTSVPGESPRKPDGGMRYTVVVDDNFHYQDERERYTTGEFDSYEDAVEKCRRIVDDYLLAAYEPAMTSEDLLSSYVSFGEDPWVSPSAPRGATDFSARTYARQRCEEICAGGAGTKQT